MFRILMMLLLLTGVANAQTPNNTTRYDAVYGLIKEKYMDSVNIDSIVAEMVDAYLNDTATIKQLLHKLDPYSYYYAAEEYADFKVNMSGIFGGVGLAFTIIEDQVYINEVFPKTPAMRAGLKPGERIAQIDDFNCHRDALDYWEVISRMRGKIGTTVTMMVVDMHGKARTVNIVREKIYVSSVTAAHMLDKHTGYIKLESFTDSSGTEVHRAIQLLKNKGMEHCILDLRDNPGGYMREALKIADEFLPDNTLEVYTIGRNGREDNFATSAGLFEKGRVTLLVNEYSASSSEILAGALQGNKRAILIGNRTFGKGLVQRMYSIGDSTEALKLTTDKYYTPLGVCIQQPYYQDDYLYTRNNEQITDKTTHNASSINGTLPEWGIIPDIYVAADTAMQRSLIEQLQNREYINHATILYYNARPDAWNNFNDLEKFMQKFIVDDEFLTFLAAQVTQWEKQTEGTSDHIAISSATAQAESAAIKLAAKSYVAQMLFGREGYYRVITHQDQAIQIAVEVNPSN